MAPVALVRPCRQGDLAAVRAIYELEVLEGTASFEIDPPGPAEMSARFEAVVARGLPYLVAEGEEGIAGYAYAAPFRSRAAYRYTVEDSVYVARWARRRGIGQALLAVVIERAAAAGMRQMVAVIGDSAHHASIRLHERAGFRMVGVLQDVGLKFGRWLDVVIMQRALGDGAANIPAPSGTHPLQATPGA